MKRFSIAALGALLVLLIGCGGSSDGVAGTAEESAPTATQETAAGSDSTAAAEQRDDEPQESATSDSRSGSGGMEQVSSVAYKEGTHYERLPEKVATGNPDKIQVTEVFWYGCSHCYDFEPMLKKWAADLDQDVVLEKSPAMWDRQGIMANHARIYYTARALGVLDTIHPAAFRALNVEGKKLRSEEKIAEFFVDHGVEREAFESTFNSFGVDSAVRQAKARQRSYRIKGTPEIIVDGTYRVAARMAGSHQAVLKVTDHLIDRIRRQSGDE